jgi:hypothetical protein
MSSGFGRTKKLKSSKSNFYWAPVSQLPPQINSKLCFDAGRAERLVRVFSNSPTVIDVRDSLRVVGTRLTTVFFRLKLLFGLETGASFNMGISLSSRFGNPNTKNSSMAVTNCQPQSTSPPLPDGINAGIAGSLLRDIRIVCPILLLCGPVDYILLCGRNARATRS